VAAVQSAAVAVVVVAAADIDKQFDEQVRRERRPSE